MKKIGIAILLASMASAHAAGMKAGLWETQQTSQIVDGRDMTAEMSQGLAMMQQNLESLPPAQRAKIQSMMGKTAAGNAKICISQAMAAKDKPVVDPEGGCEPARVTHSGNTTEFEFNCTRNGRTTSGRGTSTANGDAVITRMDMTETGSRGRHTLHSEFRMKYLGPDCQGIVPVDQMAKKSR